MRFRPAIVAAFLSVALGVSARAQEQAPAAPEPTAAAPAEKPTAAHVEKPAAPPEKAAEPAPADKAATGPIDSGFEIVVNTPVPPSQAAAPTRTVVSGRPDTAAVRDGIRAFFKGDYGRALEVLTPVSAASPAARLFYAYALAANQLVARERDAERVEQARREYQTALAEGAPKRNQWISPSIRALLEKTEAAATPAAR